MKQDNCNVSSCPNYTRYARLCGHFSGVVKPTSPIKKESKERAVINRKEYAPKARAFVKAHPICQANIKGVCTGKSVCVHHKKGKTSKENLLDEKYWLAVCMPCHSVIETNPAMAKEKGFSVSRLSKAA